MQTHKIDSLSYTIHIIVIIYDLNIFQIHNLLELVKKEQNIYNVAFNEIIRQVSFFKFTY